MTGAVLLTPPTDEQTFEAVRLAFDQFLDTRDLPAPPDPINAARRKDDR